MAGISPSYSPFIPPAPKPAPELTLAQHQTIETTLRAFEALNPAHKIHWVCTGAPDEDGDIIPSHARYQKLSDGTWSASLFTWKGKWMDIEEYATIVDEGVDDDEEYMKEMVVKRLGTDAKLTFFPEGTPDPADLVECVPDDVLDGSGFASALVTVLFPRMRPEDKDFHATGLQRFFTELAEQSGYDATKLFLEAVERLIELTVGYHVQIDDEPRGPECDGQDLYNDYLVQPSALALFKYATSTAAQAVRETGITGMSFESAILYHAPPGYISVLKEESESLPKRAAEDEPEDQPDTKKSRA